MSRSARRWVGRTWPPSDHPVYEAKGDERRFWWRATLSTEPIDNDDERDRIIARRWSA